MLDASCPSKATGSKLRHARAEIPVAGVSPAPSYNENGPQTDGRPDACLALANCELRAEN